MSALNQLHDQLVAANARLADQPHPSGTTAPPTAARPAPRAGRRAVIAVCGVAVLAGGFLAVNLPGNDSPRSGVVASILPGPAVAMADQIADRQGILHVITGRTQTRTGDGPWKPLYDPELRDEAWVALDGSGWRVRVIDTAGRATNDGLQRPDGSEQVMRRDGTIRTTPAPAGQTPGSRLPRQAWGGFVGGQLTGAIRLERVGTERLGGHQVVVVRDASLQSPRMDYRYAFDEQTGALRQVRQRLRTREGWTEDRTDITTWTIEPETAQLRRTLTTLEPLTAPHRN